MQEIITPSQVAALLQIHVKTVYRLAEQGIIPGNRIGRRWRFSRAEILALVSNGSKATSVEAAIDRSEGGKETRKASGERAPARTIDDRSASRADGQTDGP